MTRRRLGGRLERFDPTGGGPLLGDLDGHLDDLPPAHHPVRRRASCPCSAEMTFPSFRSLQHLGFIRCPHPRLGPQRAPVAHVPAIGAERILVPVVGVTLVHKTMALRSEVRRPRWARCHAARSKATMPATAASIMRGEVRRSFVQVAVGGAWFLDRGCSAGTATVVVRRAVAARSTVNLGWCRRRHERPRPCRPFRLLRLLRGYVRA